MMSIFWNNHGVSSVPLPTSTLVAYIAAYDQVLDGSCASDASNSADTTHGFSRGSAIPFVAMSMSHIGLHRTPILHHSGS